MTSNENKVIATSINLLFVLLTFFYLFFCLFVCCLLNLNQKIQQEKKEECNNHVDSPSHRYYIHMRTSSASLTSIERKKFQSKTISRRRRGSTSSMCLG